ncbi:type II CAAX prenyl endopeptidase Rce1 family protein [Botrimarina mediterranea]|uniref:CAAX amino terminal protease self-immunity n=1 Tax=Botrimarina mediterranea TaxID=2528022 RepID=A0A518KAK7_9BACT|nr:CPBP family glutamic-type intramembrane protease [Botrimarina mediterranea]QDV74825.1 CAAX amino terminal protease self- immunity [Botrimarina mediterranea]QDV79468.1 CAAX amino terminal protease self- immunity [Planctomycetes bacterium K2D]
MTNEARPATRLTALGFGETWRNRGTLAGLGIVYAVTATLIYLSAELGKWSPSFSPVGQSLALAVGFFFLPSLAEELFWRWLLIPPSCFDGKAGRTIGWVLATAAVFTAAHPVAGTFFVPHAREIFTNPAFLLIVYLLGVTCGASYVIARSIWPPVVVHWLTVLAWKFLLGGPFVLLGR